MSYEETDYGRSLWFVDTLDGKEKPQKSILSGHLVTLDEPDSSQLSLSDGSCDPTMTLNMHSAAFETKFGGAVSEDSLTVDKRCGRVFLCRHVCFCTYTYSVVRGVLYVFTVSETLYI